MTKQEFVQAVAESHQDLSKSKVEGVIASVFEVVTANLKKGEKTSWPGFGSFEVSERAAREGRNPQTGETLKIAASKGAKFKAAKGLKDALN